MLTFIFFAALIWVTWKLFGLGLKLAWGMLKLVLAVVMFPLSMVFMFIGGLLHLAFPILIIVGIITLLT